MKKLLCLLFVLSLNVHAEISFATIMERCTEQNLDPWQAEIRNRWAHRCFPQLREFIDYFSSRKPLKYALVYSPHYNSWQGPLDANAECGEWQVKSFCIASCYTPDQELLFEHGYTPILSALEQNLQKLIVLRPGSTVKNPKLQTMNVSAYSRSWKDGHELIRVIHTQSGGQLKVTQNHPVLLSSGVMVEARELVTGDFLVKQNGTLDPISKLEDIEYFGKVYNINPTSLNPIENILIAQGFLVGSGAYQHLKELNSLMGRRFMRILLTNDSKP